MSGTTDNADPVPLLRRRSSGILLHPTSLPGPEGIGTIGQEAHRFVDWLAAAEQSCWQILPLVDADEGGSPYNALSAMAGNPLLIDLAELVAEGLLSRQEAEFTDDSPDGVDFESVMTSKSTLLERAFTRFGDDAEHWWRGELAAYRRTHAPWIEDYALFRSLRQRHGAPWTRWPAPLRRHEASAIEEARATHEREIALAIFQQFLFDRQWNALRAHAAERGIAIIGDIPIFVAHDSADVWANQHLFDLDEEGNPVVVAGVPPDYFSQTGQRWGNPLFRWDLMAERQYAWWVARFRRTFEWVDVVRIDHFRGFESYWEIPAEEETAVNGEWRPGPGAGFFRAVQEQLGELPLIAEDLGLITPQVHALRDELGYPGMRVVQFAFDGDPNNPHLPYNYPARTVAYTGTHDNDTIVGWWQSAPAEERSAARDYFTEPNRPVHEAFLDLVFRSKARLTLAPLQDVLGLGSEARMNTPGTSDRNWRWRLRPGEVQVEHGELLLELTRASGRTAGTGATKPHTSQEHNRE